MRKPVPASPDSAQKPASSAASQTWVPTFFYEQQLWERGLCAVAGVDEAGRGALAGPVVAGAVIIDPTTLEDPLWSHVRDSKLLTPRQRERLEGEIMVVAAACATGMASALEIDRLGIAPATRLAMQRALATLAVVPNGLLIDWVRLPDVPLPQIARPKADRDMVSVAAASILAKVTRDRRMVAMEDAYPGYGFAAHKGYGAPQHLQALHTLGGCPEHRRTFAPLAGQLALFAAGESTDEHAHGG